GRRRGKLSRDGEAAFTTSRDRRDGLVRKVDAPDQLVVGIGDIQGAVMEGEAVRAVELRVRVIAVGASFATASDDRHPFARMVGEHDAVVAGVRDGDEGGRYRDATRRGQYA